MTPLDKQNMYKLTFGSEAGKEVMKDLVIFCFGDSTTEYTDNLGKVDPNFMLVREGRRQVLNEIKAVLEADFSETQEEVFADG